MIPGITLVGILGSGGMGAVYLGEREEDGESVAVKILAPELAGNPELEARFRREAEVLAALDHPGIVPLRSSGESRGLRFLVMDFIDGPTLDQVDPGTPEETITLGIELCEALACAHAQGIAHRDLKPTNILVDGMTGRPRITDFGLAKLSSDRAGATLLTSVDQAVGTPRFMAPEQWDGSDADARSDVFALGAILYERLCGAMPHGSIRRPSRAGASPREFDAPIMKALSPAPSDRFASAAEFGAALRRARVRRRNRVPRRIAWAFAALAALGLLAREPAMTRALRIAERRLVATQDGLETEPVPAKPAIVGPGEGPHRYFGFALSADDHLVVIGAPGASESLPVGGSGQVVVCRPRGSAATGDFQLDPVAVLESPRPHRADRFGYAVDHAGDTIVVGAWGSIAWGGAIHIFEATSEDAWKIAQVLTAPRRHAAERFGFRIALDESGRTLVVSAPGTGETADGRVFVYGRDAPGTPFAFQEVLEPDSVPPGARFGRSLALDADTLVVGCYGDGDAAAPRRGSAFVFVRDAQGRFRFDQKLVPARSRRGDYYGATLALEGDRLVVGGWKPDAGARDSGAAVVYRRSLGRWRERQMLTPGRRASIAGSFSVSLLIDGDRLLCASSTNRDADGQRRGQIVAFAEAGPLWRPVALLEGVGHDRLGASLARCRGMILAGATRHDNWHGAVWAIPTHP